MANFVLLYTGGGGMAMTEAEQAAMLQAWGVWYGELGQAVVDGGNPFTPQAKRVKSDGSVAKIAANRMATGYSILAADSLDAAVKMAQRCPILKSGGQISVYETFAVM